MSKLIYTTSEFSKIDTTGVNVKKLIATAGYSNPRIIHNPFHETENYIILIEETEDKKTFLEKLLSANVPTISSDKYSLLIPGDGKSTEKIIISDSRGKKAEHKKLIIELPDGVILAINPTAPEINEKGQATVEFGPSYGQNIVSGNLYISFNYITKEVNPITIIVRFV